MKAVLDEAGASFADIVKITTYITDPRFRDDLGSSIWATTRPPAPWWWSPAWPMRTTWWKSRPSRCCRIEGRERSSLHLSLNRNGVPSRISSNGGSLAGPSMIPNPAEQWGVHEYRDRIAWRPSRDAQENLQSGRHAEPDHSRQSPCGVRNRTDSGQRRVVASCGMRSISRQANVGESRSPSTAADPSVSERGLRPNTHRSPLTRSKN